MFYCITSHKGKILVKVIEKVNVRVRVDNILTFIVDNTFTNDFLFKHLKRRQQIESNVLNL